MGEMCGGSDWVLVLLRVQQRIGQLKIYCWSVRITVQDTEDVIHTGTVASVNLHSLVLIAL